MVQQCRAAFHLNKMNKSNMMIPVLLIKTRKIVRFERKVHIRNRAGDIRIFQFWFIY